MSTHDCVQQFRDAVARSEAASREAKRNRDRLMFGRSLFRRLTTTTRNVQKSPVRSCPTLKEWISPPGEYGMILAGETCLMHLIPDDVIPQPQLSEYKGQDSRAFYLRRSRAQELISKLRKAKAGR